MEASSLSFTPPEAPRKMICFQNPICSNGTRTPMDDWGCSHGKMWDDFCASSFMDFLLPQEQANRYELLHTYCATSSLPTQEQSRRSPLRRFPISFITPCRSLDQHMLRPVPKQPRPAGVSRQLELSPPSFTLQP